MESLQPHTEPTEDAETESGFDWEGLLRSAPTPSAGGWVQPLRNAVIRNMMTAGPNDMDLSSRIVTPWGNHLEAVDLEKHTRYVLHIIECLQENAPALVPMIDLAGATLFVRPGVLCYEVPGEEAIAIPDLHRFTHLLPWVTEDEAGNPQ